MAINKIKLIEKTLAIASANVKKKKSGPFAALVTKGGQIISSAYNSVTIKNDPTAHAEIEAIRKAAKKLNNFDLSGCEIFSSCEPCPMCLSAIYWSNIKKVYYCADKKTAAKYGFKDEMIFKELKKAPSARKVRQISLKSKNMSSPFKEWKALPDKKKY